MRTIIVIVIAFCLLCAISISHKEHNTFKRIFYKKEVVTATMYNAVEGQCDSDPYVTAGGYKINPKKASKHHWIAVSRDMLKRWGGKLKYGDRVKIQNAHHKNGIYRVVDTMNKRFTKRIDFLETKGTSLYRYENVLLAKI